MIKKYVALAAGSFLVSCVSKAPVSQIDMNYPKTKTVAHTDSYFGTSVPDAYRWLEDDRAEDTKAWVRQQSSFTENYLAQIPFREQVRAQLRNIWNYEKVSAPFKEGKYEYFYKNNGLQPQSVLYRKDANGKVEVFIDPNALSKEGTTSLSSVQFSEDGSLVAYAISEGGSDWVKIITMDVETKKIIDEPILAKFSSPAWLNNEGFFYSKYDQPKDGSMLSGMTDAHKVYFHALGTSAQQDKLIIGDGDFKRRYMTISVTDDQQFLILSAANATNGNELYIRKASDKNGDFIPVQKGFSHNTSILDSKGNTFYAITDKNAPNRKIVRFDFNNPTQWTEVIPEVENALSASTGGGYIFAKYMKDAVSFVQQFSYEGKLIREIELPGKGTANGFSGKVKEKEIYFSFGNYIMPASTYKINVDTGKTSLFYRPNVKFNSDNYVSEQVFFTSKDGTRVPMMISYKKGLKLDGKNPTILYGYGGFNASITPSFSVVNAIWMENGGVYAVPNLRGGGEYGKKWHDAGTKMNKRNVFEDFIAAGEYLHKNGYTSPEYMALSGRSNGGLLVGATMTMRPDLAKVAFPAVGVLDMLRYNQFTAGAGWAYDYGTAQDSKQMFEYLKGYSPVHNVKKGTCYPSTMVITGDHDDRVVPAHSFKFGAELQAKQACKSPVLMRIEINAGHGAGRSTEQIIGENTDLLSFALYEMGIRKLKK